MRGRSGRVHRRSVDRFDRRKVTRVGLAERQLDPVAGRFVPAQALRRVPLAAAAQEVSRFGDEVSRFADEVSRFADEVSRFGDEVSRFGDEVSRFADEVSRFTDEVSRFADEVSHFTDEGDGFANQVVDFASRVGRLAHEVRHFVDEVRHSAHEVAPFVDGVADLVDEDTLFLGAAAHLGSPGAPNLHERFAVLTVGSGQGPYGPGAAPVQLSSTFGTSFPAAVGDRSLHPRSRSRLHPPPTDPPLD